MPEPIYTLDNCEPAYQLTYSLSVFWRQRPSDAPWLAPLQAATEPDGVRVLNHRFLQENMSQFLVSTKPHVAPHALVRSVKGRLQYLVRGEQPKAFQRNYALRSIGSATREEVEKYVRSQPRHHPMADPRVQAIFERNQIENPDVDLSRPRHGDHNIYWYNLHIFLVHAERWREVSEQCVAAKKALIVRIGEKYGYLLSRAGIVSDHVHMTLGGAPAESPGEIALRFMNNLAYSEGMKRVFEFGYYASTSFPAQFTNSTMFL